MASLNGPTGMYSVKSLHDAEVVSTYPDCMYRVKSLHGDKGAQGDGSPVQQLEARQDAIIASLLALKKDVEQLSGKSRKTAQSSKVGSKSRQFKAEKLGGTIKDMVVQAHPDNPPYSLLVLYSMLSKKHQVLTSCYTHSTVNGTANKLKDFFANGPTDQDRPKYQLAITLIWKDVKNGPALMVSPVDQTAIHGEANIARYFARHLNPAYDSGDIATTTEVDSMIDLASQLIRGSNKEKAAVLRTLNGKLGKSTWLVGDSLTLADIVMWSAIKQTNQESSIPANVKKWYNTCSQQEAFKLAREI